MLSYLALPDFNDVQASERFVYTCACTEPIRIGISAACVDQRSTNVAKPNVESHTLTYVGVSTATKSVPRLLLPRNNFAAEQASPTSNGMNFNGRPLAEASHLNIKSTASQCGEAIQMTLGLHYKTTPRGGSV